MNLGVIANLAVMVIVTGVPHEPPVLVALILGSVSVIVCAAWLKTAAALNGPWGPATLHEQFPRMKKTVKSKSLSSVTSAVALTPELDDTTSILIEPLVVTVAVHVLPRVHVALAVPETVNLAEICLPLTTVPVTSAVEHAPGTPLMS